MASTTNYSWSTPDDTALVKDGAAAIRTLGSSVDTTVKALNPGTTAGDIDYYTSSTAKSRIGIGTSGQVLTVNGSGVPAWTTASSAGWTLLSTTTLSSTSTTISSISQSYNYLKIQIYGIATSSNVTPTMQFKNGATALTVSIQGTTNNTNNTQTGVTSFYIDGAANLQYLSTGGENYMTFNIDNYSTTNRKGFNLYGGARDSANAYISAINGGGAITDTAPVDAITLALSGGRTFSAGTVKIYGGN